MESKYTDTENLLNLPSTHQDDILRVLKSRYDENKIYTLSGQMIVAVNPYQYLSELYSEEKFRFYSDEIESSKSPHPWLIASQAYHDLFREKRLVTNFKFYDQSILISGESGAGKTETTKFLMSFLARRGNGASPVSTAPGGNSFDSLGPVQRKVLQTNPILDALGNAKTIRNDNSSRFGKYIKLLYNHQGELLGSSLETFLLEATRVVHQSANERNFHIFYMVCTETNPELRSLYKIQTAQSYDYLSQTGGCFDRRDGVQDSDLYQQFLEAFSILENPTSQHVGSLFAKDGTVDGLIRAVMAVLTIGNARFSSYLNSSGDVVMKMDPLYQKYIDDAAELLCLEKEVFLNSITTKSVTINGEDFVNTLDQDHAAQMKDVFAKTLYRTIFEWIIQHLNILLSTSSQSEDHNHSRHHLHILDPRESHQGVIGILDIFGFESFEVNSLEQLLINYCNENLQQQYDKVMIEKEQLLYVEEGIEWKFVEFPSAQDTISLISGIGLNKRTNHSVLGLLDEACIAPSGSDSSFIRQLYTHLENHNRMTITSLNKAKSEFGIHHYAGIVVYNAKDFVAKNKTFFFPLDELLKSSKHRYFQQLEKIATKMISSKSSNHPEHHGHHKRRLSVMQISTVASTFVSNVENLLQTISLTQTHYIKCFKPNIQQVKQNFDSLYISEQLKCAGIVHSLKVIRSGFPIRYSYKEFWDRYYALMVILIRQAMNGEIPHDVKIQIQSDDQVSEDHHDDNCLVLGVSQGVDIVIQRAQLTIMAGELNLEEVTTPKEDLSLCIQRGTSTIFLRQSGYKILTMIHNSMLGSCAVRIQSNIRQYLCRKRYHKIRQWISLLQYKFHFRAGLKKWRKRIKSLRVFLKICRVVVRRQLLIKRAVRRLEALFHRRRIIKKWRPILRVLAKFVRRAVRRVRRKCAGRFLSTKISSLYRSWRIARKWKRLIVSMRKFVHHCKLYAQRLKATRMEKAARLVLRLMMTVVFRKRVKRKRIMAIRIQHWFRYGAFRKYLDRKRFIFLLFTKPVRALQTIWRWKKRVYQSVLKEKEKRRLRGIEFQISPQATENNRKPLGKESLLHLFTQVDTSDQKDINSKLLLQTNRNILWTIFCYYADSKHCSLPASEKKFTIRITSERGVLKLLRDWGVIPAVLPMVICQQTIRNRIEESHDSSHGDGSAQAFLSYHQFSRVLLFLSTEIVKFPDSPALLNENQQRPIMSICLADAIFLDPLLMPMLGVGLRWILTAMDRSEGRNKFMNSRSAVVVPSFQGVLGSQPLVQSHISSAPQRLKQYSSTHRYRLGNIKSGPMSSDVQALVKRNESILVSMGLRYSGPDSRGSYYSRIEIPNATKTIESIENDISQEDDHHNIYHASMSVRANLSKRDQARRDAVGLTFDGLWNLLNDFGVCPEHCSKSTLREICDVAMADSTFPREDGLYSYENFIEILNLIAQNSYNNRSEFGSTEDRMSNLFSSMNKSGGRQRLIDVDRNALVIPPLYISIKEPNPLMRSSSNTENLGSSFGSTPRRSLTPTPSLRRSKTPPPISTPRNKTPPPTKRSSLTRSQTPPATFRSHSFANEVNSNNDRPVLVGSRRSSAPNSTGGSRALKTDEDIQTLTSKSDHLLPNGKLSRIPVKPFDTPPKMDSLPPSSANRLSIGRKSGIPRSSPASTKIPQHSR